MIQMDPSRCSAGLSSPALATVSPSNGLLNQEGTVMPTKKASSFETIPAGTAVSWHYRSAIGHGTVTGVHKCGTTAANNDVLNH